MSDRAARSALPAGSDVPRVHHERQPLKPAITARLDRMMQTPRPAEGSLADFLHADLHEVVGLAVSPPVDLHAELSTALQQRDEALSEVDNYHHDLIRVMRERNDALAEVERLRGEHRYRTALTEARTALRRCSDCGWDNMSRWSHSSFCGGRVGTVVNERAHSPMSTNAEEPS